MNSTFDTIVEFSRIFSHTLCFPRQIVSLKVNRVDLLSMNPSQEIDLLFKSPDIILYACNLGTEIISIPAERDA